DHEGQDDDEQGDTEDPRGGDGIDLGVRRDLRLLAGDLRSQATRRHEHGEGGDEGNQPPIGDQDAVDESHGHADGDRGEDHAAGTVALSLQCGRPYAGEGHDGAHRQVDAAADDDEGHANGDHADRGSLHEDSEDIAADPGGVAVEVRAGDRADEQQHDQHADEREVAPDRLRRLIAPPALSARASDLLRGDLAAQPGLGAHATSSINDPAMTMSSTVASSSSLAEASWMIRPSRITSTRSESPRTSGTSLETSSTPTPRSARSRINW